MSKHDRGQPRKLSTFTTENALGLSNIHTGSTPAGTVSSSISNDSLQQYIPLSEETTATRASFPSYPSSATEFQDQSANFGFYVQQQDRLVQQNTMMMPNLMPTSDGLFPRSVYLMPGQFSSPSYTTYDNHLNSYPVTYTSCQQPAPLPMYQSTAHPYFPTTLQPSRPVTSSSSSGSPDQMLMTPLMVDDMHHVENHRHYMTSLALEPPFSTPSTMQGLAHGLEGMSCLPHYASGGFTKSSGFEEAPAVPHQTPLLLRRNTDDLPFTDSPLSRSPPHQRKPYDVASHHPRRPLSHHDYQSNGLPNAVLSLDNNFLTKQRIACQGCREKKLKCTGSRPVCYNCAKKGRSQCHYVTEIKRRGPGKKRLEAEAKAGANGYYTDSTAGIPAQYAFWTSSGQGQ